MMTNSDHERHEGFILLIATAAGLMGILTTSGLEFGSVDISMFDSSIVPLALILAACGIAGGGKLVIDRYRDRFGRQ
jgi:hypothetical protein